MGYVTLLGAEDVRAAASSMRHAASEMQSAADTISESVRQMLLALEEMQRCVNDFREALEEDRRDRVTITTAAPSLQVHGIDGSVVQLPKFCALCTKPIEGEVARGPDGDEHPECAKQAKAHGRLLRPGEAAQIKERLGIKED